MAAGAASTRSVGERLQKKVVEQGDDLPEGPAATWAFNTKKRLFTSLARLGASKETTSSRNFSTSSSSAKCSFSGSSTTPTTCRILYYADGPSEEPCVLFEGSSFSECLSEAGIREIYRKFTLHHSAGDFLGLLKIRK
ncbi:unnamed protein product [Amoebophrya sp. A25]|nr:unnamed protein product [Amoebophrya sp. A25]|eukprot:GSA25T00008437001.1